MTESPGLLALSLFLALAPAEARGASTSGGNWCAECGRASPVVVRLPALPPELLAPACEAVDARILNGLRGEYREFRESRTRGAIREASIRGRKVRGTAEEIDLLKRITRANFSDGLTPWLKGSLPASWIRHDPGCEDAECAFRAAYDGDEEMGMRAYVIGLKHRQVLRVAKPNPITEERWTVTALRRISEDLDRLPERFVHSRNRGYTVVEINDRLGPAGQAVATDQSIQLVTAAGAERDVLIHEMGHLYEYRHGKGSDFAGLDGGRHVSDYAAKNDLEDFAESVANYVRDPGRLARLAPEKYRVVRERVMKGREFVVDPNLPLPRAQLLRRVASQLERLWFPFGVEGLMDADRHYVPIWRQDDSDDRTPEAGWNRVALQLNEELRERCADEPPARLNARLREAVKPMLDLLADAAAAWSRLPALERGRAGSRGLAVDREVARFNAVVDEGAIGDDERALLRELAERAFVRVVPEAGAR